MRSCFSCICKSLSLPSSSPIKFSNVRVVRLNGWVENFDLPVAVIQLTDNPPKLFASTAAQLLSTALKPSKPQTLLERGRLYFLVPSSTFQVDVSCVDLAVLVKWPTAKANKAEAKYNSPRSRNSSPLWSPYSLRISPILETYGVENCSKKEPWRPNLDTIRKMSFNRRKKSDLRDKSFTKSDLRERSLSWISESDLPGRHFGKSNAMCTYF